MVNDIMSCRSALLVNSHGTERDESYLDVSEEGSVCLNPRLIISLTVVTLHYDRN